MKENGVDAYIIYNKDPHIGEYIPEHWRIIEWLTGFTGSNATVVVTDTFAGLWTDSRYFIQAEKQLLNSGFCLVLPDENVKYDYSDWLGLNLIEGKKIGLDGRTISISGLRKIEKGSHNKNIRIETDCDLVTEIWQDRPAMPSAPAYDFPLSFCGKERSEKIKEVRDLMKVADADYHLLTGCDDIMWMLNMRGNDLKYSPLISSFVLVGEEQILLFADESRIPFKLALEFDRLGIVLLPYEEIEGMIMTLEDDSSLLVNPATTSASIFNSVPAGIKIIEGTTIPARLKSVKNLTEIENIKKAMVKDGVALTKFYHWLEKSSGTIKFSEPSLAEKLDSFRTEQENYIGSSFSTIVAWKENGALPHYSAKPESDAAIDGNGLLLIDSGGQYYNGTTDITRTIVIGKPTPQQIKDFSLVLKGNINLNMAIFPAGTKGYQLDVLARQFLWQNGLNYGHGTGHGVGFFLNVHEGPQSISPAAGAEAQATLQAGMLISNEPAVYRVGEYGIRIENLMICREHEVSEAGKFLKFEAVSLCYIDKSLIDLSILDRKEIEWLNDYHKNVYEKLSPLLTVEEMEWLKKKTEYI